MHLCNKNVVFSYQDTQIQYSLSGHIRFTAKNNKLFFCIGVEEFSSERITLRVDVTGPENMPFAGTAVQRSAGKVYRLGQSKG